MKKSVLIETLLFLLLILMIYFTVIYWRSVAVCIEHTLPFETFRTALAYAILFLLADLALISVMILTALKDFAVFKPLVDKYEAKVQARKNKRIAAKAERAEADRQAKITELESQLEELKKD